MQSILSLLQWIFLIPVVGGSIYAVLCLIAVLRFRKKAVSPTPSNWPPVTVLKPVCGLEKNQRENLRSACLQDYPEFQVVYSVQNLDDPVIPLLKEIQREFGPERVSVAVESIRFDTNGKINNLMGALPNARYDILIISDSDVYHPHSGARRFFCERADSCGPVRSFFRRCQDGRHAGADGFVRSCRTPYYNGGSDHVVEDRGLSGFEKSAPSPLKRNGCLCLLVFVLYKKNRPLEGF